MTLTTQVRINHPVSAEQLLDVVTVAAGGVPSEVVRWREPGEVGNLPAQCLATWARVRFSERSDVGYDEQPMPPALVVLSIDNTWASWPSAYELQVGVLRSVVAWLDEVGVPRSSWWWEDECAGSFHPGSVDVGLLLEAGERETWAPAAC